MAKHMGQHLRISINDLASLTSDTVVDFALISRNNKIMQAGSLSLQQLSIKLPNEPIYLLTAGPEIVTSQITVPPVTARQLPMAVKSTIEPMVLSPMTDILFAYGKRLPDGQIDVVWASQALINRACSTFKTIGLNLLAIIPQSLLGINKSADGDVTALTLPAGPNWQTPLPDWSLTDDLNLTGLSLKGWLRPILWFLLAIVVWLIGLNVYAYQQHKQLQNMQSNMRALVQKAFPDLPVIIDPVRQARQQLESLQFAAGAQSADNFMFLAMSAANVLDFAVNNVKQIEYADNVLTIIFTDDYRPPTDESYLLQAAAVHRLSISKDGKQPGVWYVSNIEPEADHGGES